MSKIILYPSGHAVDCAAGDTVLSALEQAGYALPNNCRAGACGECKIRVRNGRFDQGMVLDMALSQTEREQGFGLMCMAKPLTDTLEIEWGSDQARPKLFPPREDMVFLLVDLIPRTPRILELRLLSLGAPMRYWPGQYVLLNDAEQKHPQRAYSIANAPRIDGEITLQVSRVEGGDTSRWVHDSLRPGDRLRICGPYGAFIGDPSAETPVLCLAAGSGLAPIMALAEAALARGYRHPVSLLFSARRQQDVYDLGRLALWQARYRNFRFIRTLTGESGEPPNGRIPQILPQMFPDLSEYSVFVAGGTDFVDQCVAAAKSLGAREELVHTEGFHRQQSAAPAMPPLPGE